MNRLDQTKIDEAFSCFRACLGVNATARKLGIAKNTAAKYLRLYEAGAVACVLCACGKPRHRGWCKAQELRERVESFCECGKPLRHRGWCKVRYARSPARQAVMRRLHGQQPIIYCEPLPALSREQKKVAAVTRAAVIRRSRRSKDTVADLTDIIAAYKGPIKKYPAGAHSGWRPSWLDI